MTARVRGIGLDPRVGDTLILGNTAVMVLGRMPGGFTGSDELVRFRTRDGTLKRIWEDSTSIGAWDVFVQNWLEHGAAVVPAESVEQIYPQREAARRVRAKQRDLRDAFEHTCIGLSQWTEGVP